jgi:hypothetical protein
VTSQLTATREGLSSIELVSSLVTIFIELQRTHKYKTMKVTQNTFHKLINSVRNEEELPGISNSQNG